MTSEEAEIEEMEEALNGKKKDETEETQAEETKKEETKE